MKYVLMITATLMLGACGVDGEPKPVETAATPKPGISVTGRAEVGVAKRS